MSADFCIRRAYLNRDLLPAVSRYGKIPPGGKPDIQNTEGVKTGMIQEKLSRINELARLSKERELTLQEQEERDILRKEYITEWRRGAEQVLENTFIVTPDGKKHKLEKRRDR